MVYLGLFFCVAIVFIISYISIKLPPTNVFFSVFFGVIVVSIIMSWIMPQLLEKVWIVIRNFLMKKKYYDSLLSEHLIRSKNKQTLDTGKHKTHFLKLFKSKKIDEKFIDNLTDIQAVVFIIGLQFYYEELKISEGINSTQIEKVADKAASNEEYKKILLNISLNSLCDDLDKAKTLGDKVLESSTFIPVTDVKKYSEKRLFERVESSEQETIYIFSTTSQISNLSLDVIKSNSTKIEEINYFLISPLIETHEALLELRKEYDVPKFAIPPFQFIENEDDLDMLRRTIKILDGIRNTVEFSKQSDVKINLYLFKEKYPDIKIRLLKNNCYLQLFPSGLKYANNLYRYGMEIYDKLVVDKFVTIIDTMVKDTNKIEKIELNELEYEIIKEKAIKEIFYYILKKGYTPEKVKKVTSELQTILKVQETESYVDNILNLSIDLQNFINEYKFTKRHFEENEKIYTDVPCEKNDMVIKQLNNNDIVHISVGMLFFRDNKTLVIRKKQKPYTGKLSIVAGHLENGETPKEAIIREVKEEIGIDVKNFELIEDNYYIDGDTCKYGFNSHLWFVFKCNEEINDNKLLLSESEIAEIDWIDISNLNEIDNFTFAAEKIVKRCILECTML